MSRFSTCLLGAALFVTSSLLGGVAPFELTREWSDRIDEMAPEVPQRKPAEARRVLVFTLMTGFQHWATPHTAEVVRILGEKSGAYEAVVSDDPSHFKDDNLEEFDAVVLINNCSKKPERNLFFDVLGDRDKAAALEKNLIDYVAGGGGLVAIHGGIVMLNKSEKFGELMGGSFEYHPAQTTVVGKVVDLEHPISTAFDGGKISHFDEPYCFDGAYTKFDFRPLLEMELPDVSEDLRTKVFAPNDRPMKRYISWIKSYGEGRVFYCSPSHNAQSFEDPELLEFVLNGIQYSLGDLECDDSPLR